MARKYATGTLIHCEACGEDFSATYKRCPFCGEKPGDQPTTTIPQIDEYVFEGGDVFDDVDGAPTAPSRGGKRLAGGIHDDIPAAVNWTRLITFICSLVIIAAALVIVFTVVYPAIHVKDPTTMDSPPVLSQGPVSQPSAPPAQDVPPSTPASEQPVVTDAPVVSDPPVVTPTPTLTPTQPPISGGGVTSLTLNKSDFTLPADDSYTLKATIAPAGWAGTVSWTSANPDIATVDANGKVVNVNSSANKRSTTITCTAGGQTATCKVYCNGGSTGGGESSAPVAELELNKSDVSIVVGESFTLKGEGAEGITWSSADSGLATVDADGRVTGTGSGRTTITGTASNGAVGTCIVRVRNGG